jgi:hypothetical protein
MAIDPEGFKLLEQAYQIAAEKKLLLLDIMTERHEITTMLQKELSTFPDVFGEQEKGSKEDPAVTKESVHHFSKLVNGAPLQRPPWFYDPKQQGEAIVDVTTHLTDLVQWECFPGQTIAPDDVKVLSAKSWTTEITREQFRKSTGLALLAGLPERPDRQGQRAADTRQRQPSTTPCAASTSASPCCGNSRPPREPETPTTPSCAAARPPSTSARARSRTTNPCSTSSPA